MGSNVGLIRWCVVRSAKCVVRSGVREALKGKGRVSLMPKQHATKTPRELNKGGRKGGGKVNQDSKRRKTREADVGEGKSREPENALSKHTQQAIGQQDAAVHAQLVIC